MRSRAAAHTLGFGTQVFFVLPALWEHSPSGGNTERGFQLGLTCGMRSVLMDWACVGCPWLRGCSKTLWLETTVVLLANDSPFRASGSAGQSLPCCGLCGWFHWLQAQGRLGHSAGWWAFRHVVSGPLAWQLRAPQHGSRSCQAFRSPQPEIPINPLSCRFDK